MFVSWTAENQVIGAESNTVNKGSRVPAFRENRQAAPSGEVTSQESRNAVGGARPQRPQIFPKGLVGMARWEEEELVFAYIGF